MPKIVITNRVYPPVLALLSSHGNVVANQEPTPWSAERLAAEAADADALMVFMPDSVDGAFLERAPHLKIVACALKGSDNFDVAACTERDVWVSIVPDLLTEPTAELAIGLMIGLARLVPSGDAWIRSGDFAGWRPTLYGTGLKGARVGILGMGAIGRALAERLRAFGPSMSYWDQRTLSADDETRLGVRFVERDALFGESDFVVCALPMTPDTLHVVDAAALARMPKGAFLINPARGSLVDERAVADALEAGHLAGYAADVFEMEDWARADRPRSIDPRLLAMTERTLFTPHLGSAVASVRLAIEMDAANNIIDVLSGRRPRGAVNEPRRA